MDAQYPLAAAGLETAAASDPLEVAAQELWLASRAGRRARARLWARAAGRPAGMTRGSLGQRARARAA